MKMLETTNLTTFTNIAAPLLRIFAAAIVAAIFCTYWSVALSKSRIEMVAATQIFGLYQGAVMLFWSLVFTLMAPYLSLGIPLVKEKNTLLMIALQIVLIVAIFAFCYFRWNLGAPNVHSRYILAASQLSSIGLLLIVYIVYSTVQNGTHGIFLGLISAFQVLTAMSIYFFSNAHQLNKARLIGLLMIVVGIMLATFHPSDSSS